MWRTPLWGSRMKTRREGITRDFGYVLDCAPADRRRFETAVAHVPSLIQVRERGLRSLRSFSTLLTDVFCYFYLPDPILRPSMTLSVDRLNFFILKFLCESREYRALRVHTGLNFDAALAATEQFAEKLLTYFQSELHRRKEGARPTDDLKRVEIEGIVFADRARAGSGHVFDHALLVIAKEIEDSMEGHRLLADLSRSWGIEPGVLRQLSYEERAALAQQVHQNPKLRRLAELVGRYRQLAINKQKTRIADLPHEVTDVTQGEDWARFLAQELVVLTHPALRYEFYLRLIDAKVHQYDLHGEETVGKGSLVMCIDTSGSMSGEPELVAKAIALGLVEIARLQRRHWVAILFSSAREWLSFAFKEDGIIVRMAGGAEQSVSFLEGVMRLGAEFFGGGTDYESPLREAMRFIQQDEANCKDGDIVFITDDYCEVSDAFLTEYAAAKVERGFSTYSVIIGARAADARTLKKFSDEVISSFELTEDVAGRLFEAV